MSQFELDLRNAKISDPKIGMKVGNLQKYAKSLAKKLYITIHQKGFYENAGQQEFFEWENRKEKYGIHDYHLENDLKQMTRNLFYNVGNGNYGPDVIKEFSYKGC